MVLVCKDTQLVGALWTGWMAAKLAGVDLILLGSQRFITNVALRLVRITLFRRALKLKN